MHGVTMKFTATHSRYVILIAFPLQQWLHERTSMLRCTYIACLVRSAYIVHLCSFVDLRTNSVYFHAHH